MRRAPSRRRDRSRPGTRGSARLPEAHGFSLVEVMVAIVLAVLVLGSAFAVLIGVNREYVRQRDSRNAQNALRTSEMAIAAILRSAEADPYETGNALLDPNPLANPSFDNLRVKADHNPPDGDFADPLEDVLLWLDSDTLFVRWQAGTTAEAYAAPITELTFRYYDEQGNELTDPAEIATSARRVRFVLAADKGPRAGAVDRREGSAYLRNRE